MSALQLIALASTVSLLAGWRLYLVTFAVGIAMKFGWIALPQQLRALDVLANNWIIGIAAIGTLAEFFADKIAWVDSAWEEDDVGAKRTCRVHSCPCDRSAYENIHEYRQADPEAADPGSTPVYCSAEHRQHEEKREHSLKHDCLQEVHIGCRVGSC